MKFCPQCGAAMEAGDRFCQNCGFKLSAPPPASPPDEDPEKTRIMPPRRPAESGSGAQAQAAASVPPPRPEPERQSRAGGAGTASSRAPAQADPFAGAQARQAWFGWLLGRVRNILFKPKEEWPAIDAEAETVAGLYKRYIVPLQGAAALAGWLGAVFVLARIGIGTAIFGGLASSIVGFVLALALVFVIALVVNALAPSFGGQKNQISALKLVAYSYTPSFIGGLLMILPILAPLMILFALYGLYLLYLGLPPLMKCPREKAPVYTVVIVVIAIVLSLVMAMITGGMAALVGMGGHGAARIGETGPSSAVLDGLAGKDATKRLEAMTKKMEEANKKIEAAEKSGDSAAAAAAASEALGAALSGGRKVEPVDFRELKALLPESVGGMKRTEARGEKSGMGGLMVATAEGTYGGDGERSVDLKVVDMGGAGLGMMGLAAWSMVEVDKETESGRERTGKLGGRPFHEKYDTKTRSGEFALVVGQRFLVEASGGNVDLQTLKNAVAAVDLAKLEAMKDVGVTQ